MKHEKSVTDLEKLQINGSEQWVLVRGKNPNAPLLIHVQAGPGLPMISEANAMEKNLHLEDRFLVVYWDQRGCGKSFSKDMSSEAITLNQLTDDLIVCSCHLLKKYNQHKVILAGYSIGATISLMAAAKDSTIFSSIFATGTDTDIPYANQYALDFAMNKAVEGNNKKLIDKINELKRGSIDDSKRFQQRAEILTNLGGVKAGSNYSSLVLGSVKNMLFSKHYGIRGMIKTMKAMAFSQNALLPEFNRFNLFKTVKRISVPVHFIQGSLDAVAPPARGKEYYDQLQAFNKSFTLFERSAHLPQYEEPEKFSNLILSFLNN